MAKPAHLFVIDTEQYAGNFERQLCAWCTGQVGECGVGDSEAEDFRAAHPEVAAALQGLVRHFDRDGSGCKRPACLVATPGWLNNGMGFHFKDTPAQRKKALTAFKRDMVAYDQSQLAMVERRLAEQSFETTPHGWTRAACERTQARILASRAEVANMEEPHRYPAYLSVGIGFRHVPRDEVVELMQQRAALYAAQHKLTITGYRLIKD